MAITDLKPPDRPPARAARVYLYFNRAGETILRRQGPAPARPRPELPRRARVAPLKTDALLDEVHALEVIVTDSVVEARPLREQPDQQRLPRYNVMLRDDKSYPYLKLTTGEACPRLHVARRVERDGHPTPARSCPHRWPGAPSS